MILVNSGATHNLISRKLVVALGLRVEETHPMRIKIGNGYKATTQGTCKGIELKLGEITIPIDTFLFDLEWINIVLGISWLTSLGRMWVDLGKQSMQFQLENKWVELQGETKGVVE